MPLVSKADFLAKDDAAYEEVEIPNWGDVRLRSLSGAGRDTYLRGIMEVAPDGTRKFKTEDAEARLLAVSLVDEQGNLWFDNVDEGVRVLRDRNADSLQKAFNVALRLNALSAEAVEEAVASLDETQSEGHG